jgi:hypothetical protein
MSLFTEVRKTALLACITAALILVWLSWSQIQTIPLRFWTSSLSIAGTLISIVTPVFYFAVYRNEAPLTFPGGLRKLSLVAAIAFGLLIAADLPAWIEWLNFYSTHVRAFGRAADSETLRVAVRLVGEASNVSYTLLLVAIFRAPADPSSPPPVPSGLLEVTSRLAVVLTGLWLAYTLISTGYAPYFLREHRAGMLETTRDQATIRFLGRAFRNLLTAACMFAAPYM